MSHLNLFASTCPTCGGPADLDVIETHQVGKGSFRYPVFQFRYCCLHPGDTCESSRVITVDSRHVSMVKIGDRQVGGPCPSGCGENLYPVAFDGESLVFECATGKTHVTLLSSRFVSHATFTVKVEDADLASLVFLTESGHPAPLAVGVE